MLDLNSSFGKRLQKRLQRDEIIWFTCVSPKGRPSTNPVWFYWDGRSIFVYSQPRSFRVHNLRRNPNVSLHLDGAAGSGSGGVYIIDGVASIHPGNKVIPEGYWKKYKKHLAGIDLTVDGMTGDYSVAIEVKPTRARGD